MSQQMGVAPWVIDPDERIKPWEWASRAKMVMGVEAESAEWHRKQSERKQRMKRR